MLKLYENIKKRRIDLGMTQEQLAQKMGYADKTMISKIEKGLIDLPYTKIIEFSKVLMTSPGELMGWTEPDPETISIHWREMPHKKIEIPYDIYINTEIGEILVETQKMDEKSIDKLSSFAKFLNDDKKED